MKWIAVLIIATVLVAGCVQSTTYSNQTTGYLKESDFGILGYSWGFQDDCQYGKESVAYVKATCRKGLKCEVYVNDIKSNYGTDGLQDCDEQLVVAEVETSVKPEFVAVQSQDKYYYTRRDRSKNVEICCSIMDPTTNKLDREEEICQTMRIEAQCPEFASKGFDKLPMISWHLFYDGTLELKIRNEVGQDIAIRKFYINGVDTKTDYTTTLPIDSYSPTMTATGGPVGSLGSSYNISLSIEYTTLSNANVRINSTGTLTGLYS